MHHGQEKKTGRHLAINPHIIPNLVILFSIFGLGGASLFPPGDGNPYGGAPPILGPPGNPNPGFSELGPGPGPLLPPGPPGPIIQGCCTRLHASFSQYALPPTSKYPSLSTVPQSPHRKQPTWCFRAVSSSRYCPSMPTPQWLHRLPLSRW